MCLSLFTFKNLCLFFELAIPLHYTNIQSITVYSEAFPAIQFCPLEVLNIFCFHIILSDIYSDIYIQIYILIYTSK